MQRDKTLWTRYAILLLGLWLIAQPLTFAEKSVPLAVSDIASGFLLLIFGALALSNSQQWILWVIALIGVWLQFAPLLFFAPNAVSYLNDTLVGVLAIACSVLIPENGAEEKLTGESIPPGWSYNPSAWLQRLPIALFGFLAWMFARYMTSFQLGYIGSVWDPIFGDGTERVITSNISKDFPVPDAGLGAMAYTLEVLMACHGSFRRWHTIPWFVVLFAILVIPLGFVSIVLIILQPIIVGAWCFWCLLTALCMLLMIALAVDEVAAVLQYLFRSKREGKSLWQIFWKGGDAPDAGKDNRSPAVNAPLGSSFPAMTWGISLPWNLIVTALLGLWLMFSPHILEMYQAASDSDHIAGALIFAFSIISIAEVTRSCRFLVLLLGIWVFFSSWILAGNTLASTVSHSIAGILLVLFSIPKGEIKEKYGDLGRYIV